MIKSNLIAQGSYGCVYYPGYSCSTNDKNHKYVSKLSRDDKTTQVEYNMGQIVKKIKNYSKHFIIIENKCKLKKKKLDYVKDGCNFIEKHEFPSYVLLYSRYLKSKELADILSNTSISYYKIIQLTNTLYNRITQLYSVGIIHMDLHFGNVLVSTKSNRLYVIDFGLALDNNKFFIGNKINLKYIKEKWFNYKTDWPSWSLEYIFISLIVKENEILTKENILSTITNYYKNNNVLSNYLDKPYIKFAYDFYKSFENNSSEENIRLLINYSNTWDYYKLGYHILSYMFRKSIKFVEFEWLLLLMMHPNPTYRPSKEELKESFIYYLQEFKEYESFKIYKDEGSVRLQEELSKSIKDL